MSSIRFLARQGLSLRGDKDEGDSNFNFMQILQLKAEENPSIGVWLLRTTKKHTCYQIQDEILKIMALQVIREVASNIRLSPFITIMADETTDIANKERSQLSSIE